MGSQTILILLFGMFMFSFFIAIVFITNPVSTTSGPTTLTLTSITSKNTNANTSTSPVNLHTSSSSPITNGNGGANGKLVWARMPDSWCSENLLVRKNDQGQLQCENNAINTSCNWRPLDETVVPPNVPWRTITDITGEGMILAWYYANGEKCEPHCPEGGAAGIQKLLHDGDGGGCGGGYKTYVPPKI